MKTLKEQLGDIATKKTEEYKKMVAEKEKAANEHAIKRAAEIRSSATGFFQNMINGIAYKFDIPKEKLIEFEKFVAKKLIEHCDYEVGDSINEYSKMIELMESYAQSWQYSNEFQDMVQGPE